MPQPDPTLDPTARATGDAAGAPAPSPRRSPVARVLLAPLDLVVGLFVLLDAVIGPLLRPLLRLVGRLRLVAALERGVAALPPYGILAALAVPFAVAEPLKLIALVWLAEGRVVTGVSAMVFAYVLSLVVVERMYHAGRGKLLTIGWFARLMGWLAAVRDVVMGRLRTTAIWRVAHEAAAAALKSARAALAWVRSLASG